MLSSRERQERPGALEALESLLPKHEGGLVCIWDYQISRLIKSPWDCSRCEEYYSAVNAQSLWRDRLMYGYEG